MCALQLPTIYDDISMDFPSFLPTNMNNSGDIQQQTQLAAWTPWSCPRSPPLTQGEDVDLGQTAGRPPGGTAQNMRGWGHPGPGIKQEMV
jgi:hypothetical protein